MKWTILFALALMGACGDIGDSGDSGDAGNSGDSGNSESMSLLVISSIGGVEVTDLEFTVNDGASILDRGYTGVEASLKVTDDSMIWVGGADKPLTTDGRSIVVVGDKRYVHEDAPVDGDEVDVNLNRYVVGTDVECEFYRNGEYRDTYTEDFVETEDGYVLSFPNTIGEGSWFETDGDSATFVGALPEDGFKLISFEFGDSGVSFSYGSSDYDNSFICSF